MVAFSRANAVTETAQKVRIPLLNAARAANGAVLAAAAGSGVFGVTSGGYGTGGTKLVGEAASGNSKTNTVKYTVPLPQNYVAGASLTLKVKARVTVTPNTGASIDAGCFLSNENGGVTGGDQVTTAVQTLTTSWTEFSFAVTGTSFTPGCELDIYIQTVVDDSSGATGAVAEIGGVFLETSTMM